MQNHHIDCLMTSFLQLLGICRQPGVGALFYFLCFSLCVIVLVSPAMNTLRYLLARTGNFSSSSREMDRTSQHSGFSINVRHLTIVWSSNFTYIDLGMPVPLGASGDEKFPFHMVTH